jgi:hypothetical protein
MVGGGILVLVGGLILGAAPFLPWWGICFDFDFAGITAQCLSVSGFHDWPGYISVALGIASVVLGIIALSSPRAARGVGGASLAGGIVALGVAVASIAFGKQIIGAGVDPRAGTFVALGGGLLVVLGGILLLSSGSVARPVSAPPPPPPP